MRIVAQTDDSRLLSEALNSNCDGVRFGSEFCEHLLPDLDTLKRAYELARNKEKEFTYVTPRLSNAGIEKLKEQLCFLGETKDISVVVNDFGALNVLKHHLKSRLHLGRHLVVSPSRSPWSDKNVQSEEAFPERGEWVRNLFGASSLSYQPTIDLYRGYGFQGADVDWIPRTFSSLGFLVENGLSLAVHFSLVPVTFSRRCHTARFLGEEDPEKCSRPCLHSAFLLSNEVLDTVGQELFLHGNAVFRVAQASRRDIVELRRSRVSQIVLTMNALTLLDTTKGIDDLILDIGR